jgi:L-threonylcarbamoyladenylate synthase
MISNVLGKPVHAASGEITAGSPASSPGMKYTHYKPEAEVGWIPESAATSPEKNTLWLVHSNRDIHPSDHIICYQNNFSRLAAELFDQFRRADRLGYQKVLIERLPPDQQHPIIPALRNRIEKAIG